MACRTCWRGDLRLNVGNVFGLRGLAAALPLLPLLAAILCTVPWVERLLERWRVTCGTDSIENTQAET